MIGDSMKKGLQLLSILLMLLLLGPISSDNMQSSGLQSHLYLCERDYWPTNGWLNTTPEEQGMDSSLLNEMIDYIEEEDIAINSVVVVKNGYIVLEKYFRSYQNENSTYALYSVTKSFTSALVGIAVDQGYIDNVSQLVLPFFPEYEIANVDERRERITIEDLLTMRSGLFWDESSAPFTSPANGIYHLMVRDGVNYTLNLDMVSEPGTEFLYNTGASHLLAAIVWKATGMSTLAFAEENLFGPLGIDHVSWYRDAAGWYRGGFDLILSTRSMAKFGYLYLNNGTWDGEQILSEEWVQDSIESYTLLNQYHGYGYQWHTDPEVGLYYAAGLYGQFIFVIPEHDIVVAFTSNLGINDPAPHENLVLNYVVAADGGIGDPQLDILPILTVVLVAPVAIAAVYYVFVLKRR